MSSPEMSVNPEATTESTPEVAAESTPEVAAESTPEVADESTPEVAAESTPEVADESTPEPAQEQSPPPQSYGPPPTNDGQINLLTVPINNENDALNALIGFLSVAQRRGTFAINESAKIFECVKRFQR
jgi:hypothetical protein